RKKNAGLAPEAYGKNFVQFAQEMKAVDARIKVGIPLDKPLAGQINRDEWTQDPVTGKYQQNASVSVKEDFNKGIDWDKGGAEHGVQPGRFRELALVSQRYDTGFRLQGSG